MTADLPSPIEGKLAQLPKATGVYLLLDARGKVIYVGKAKSLRARVRSYFQGRDDGRALYPFLVREVVDLEWFVTSSDQEALLLENNLIKQHRPRYNVKLVDDKTYLSIKLTTHEPFPRALLVRRVRQDGARYFGPYGSARAIRETLRTVRRFFPLRTCTNAEFRQRTRPCIQHQIGRCGAPCVGLQDAEAYARGVREVAMFLSGRTTELREELESQMLRASEALEYERAARLRDQIRAIERTSERQHAVAHDQRDRDVYGELREGDDLHVQALFYREGRLTGSHTFSQRTRLATAEALRSLIVQLYTTERSLPDEILLPLRIDDAAVLARLLSERRGKRVSILAPERGKKRELIELARENARQRFRLEAERTEAHTRALADLQTGLGLTRHPTRIDCVDLSTTGGAHAVGAVVAMRDGELDPRSYRRLEIRDPLARGDTQRMREVLERHLRRAKKDGRLPDLVLLDGGLAQLEEGVRVRRALDLETEIDLAAIAKSRSEAGRVKRAAGNPDAERVFLPGRTEPVVLTEGSPAMHLLQRLRDEAHRFAITYHRTLRNKRSLRSVLLDIPGIGPRRARALLEHFGSLGALAEASLADIALCPTISPTRAEAIHTFFQEQEAERSV